MEENNKDITQTGPKPLKGIRGKDLPSQQQKQPSALDYAIAVHNKIASNNIGYSKLDESFATPKITEGVNYGASTYDEGIITNIDQTTINNLRAEKQSAFTQAFNGIMKGVITAGTTFVDGIAGLAYGVGQSFYNAFNHDKEQSWVEGMMEGLWNNPVNKLMNDIQRGSEDAFVNYKTEEQINSNWYDPSNLFSANFIFDTVVKNLGFTVGALYSGGIYTKALNYIAKGATMAKMAGLSEKSIEAGIKAAEGLNNIKTAKLITGSFLSAHAEAMTEAYNTYRDMKDIKGQELQVKRAQDRNDAIRKFIDKGGVLDALGNPDPSSNPEDAKELTDRLNAIENAYNEANKSLDLEARRAATMDGMLNIPVLTLDNALTFGRLFTGGYKNARGITRARIKATKEAERAAKKAGRTAQKKLERIVNRANEKGGLDKLTAAQRNLVTFDDGHIFGPKMGAFLTGFKAPIREGNEEMAQAMASQLGQYTFGKTVDDIYAASLDGKARKESESFFENMFMNIIPAATKEWRQAFSDTYGNPKRWEEGFVGAITGFMGSPIFGKLARKNRGMTIGKEGVMGLQGGTFEEVSNYLKRRREERQMIDNANAVIRDPEGTASKLKHLITMTRLNDIKQRAVIHDDEKDWKDARTAQDFELIRHLDNVGRLDILEDILENSTQFTDEDYKYIQELVKQEKAENGEDIKGYKEAINNISEQIKQKDQEIEDLDNGKSKEHQFLEETSKQQSEITTALEKNESKRNFLRKSEEYTQQQEKLSELQEQKKQLEEELAKGGKVKNKIKKLDTQIRSSQKYIRQMEEAAGINIEEEEQLKELDQQLAGHRKEASDKIAANREKLSKEKEELISELSKNQRAIDIAGIYTESPYIHDNGTEYTLEEIKETVQKQRERFGQILDTYKEAKTEIDEATSGALTNDQLGTLTWYNVMSADWGNRADKIVDVYKKALTDLINSPKLNDMLKNYDEILKGLESVGIDPKTFKIQFGGRMDSLEFHKAMKSAAENLLEELNKGGRYFAQLLAFPAVKTEMGTIDLGKSYTENLIAALSASQTFTGVEAEKMVKAIKDLRSIGEGLRKYNELLDKYLGNPDELDTDKAKLEVNEQKKQEEEEDRKKQEELDKQGDPYYGKLGKLVMHLIDNGNLFQDSKKLKAYKESRSKEEQDKLEKAGDFFYFYDDLTSQIRNSSELSDHAKQVLIDLVNKLMYDCDNVEELTSKLQNIIKTEKYLDELLPGILGSGVSTQEFEAEKEAIAKNIFEWVNKHLQEIIDGFPRYLQQMENQTTPKKKEKEKNGTEETKEEKDKKEKENEIKEFIKKVNWNDYFYNILQKFGAFAKTNEIKISEIMPFLNSTQQNIIKKALNIYKQANNFLQAVAAFVTEDTKGGNSNAQSMFEDFAEIWSNLNKAWLLHNLNSFNDVLSKLELAFKEKKISKETLQYLNTILERLQKEDPDYTDLDFRFSNTKTEPKKAEEFKGGTLLGTSETGGDTETDEYSGGGTTKEKATKDNDNNNFSNRSNETPPDGSDKRQITQFVKQNAKDRKGVTLTQYYEDHKDAIPKGVDHDAFMKQLLAIHDKLNKLGAFEYVDQGNLHEGDTIYFTMDKELNKDAGTPVILLAVKDKDGKEHIIGSLYTQIDLNSIDKSTGKPMKESNPEKQAFYDKLVAELELGSNKYSEITTTINGFYGGDVACNPEDASDVSVSDVFRGAPIPIAIVTSTGITTNDAVKNPLSISEKIPGQVYVYITAQNTGITIPMKCWSTNLRDLKNGDWYLEQMKNAVKNVLDLSTDLPRAKQELLQWFPKLPNFHINLYEKNGKKYLLFGWGVNNAGRIANTYSFDVTEGTLDSAAVDRFVAKICNETITTKDGEKLPVTTNVSPQLIKDTDYVNHISNYLYTDVLPGHPNSVNSGFTFMLPYKGKHSTDTKGKTFEGKTTTKKEETSGGTVTVSNDGSIEGSEGAVDAAVTEIEDKANGKKSRSKKLSKLEALLGKKVSDMTAKLGGMISTKGSKDTSTRQMTTFEDQGVPIQKTTQEQLKDSVEQVKQMIPSLSEEGRIKLVEGLIKTVDAQGSPIEVYGLFKDGILYVSNQSPVGTAFHEAFHYVYSTLLNSNEQIALFTEAAKQWGNKSQIELEERLSEAFRQYMLLQNDTSIKGRLKRIFSTLKHIALSLIGKESQMDSIFNQIYRNKIESGRNANTIDSKKSQKRYQQELALYRINKYQYENISEEERAYLQQRGFTQENYEKLNSDQKEILLHCM